MTSLQLQYAVALDKYKSYVIAADHLNVTQPALTMQIKNLEEELGVVLFDRSKKPIVTTEIGRKIIDQAAITLREMYKIADMVEEYKDELSGKLRVGIIPTISPYLVPFFIKSFNQKYPKIRLEIVEEITENIIRNLKDGEMDAGLIVTPIEAPSVETTPLFYEKFMIYVSDQHPLYYKEEITLKNLELEDLWLLNEGNCFRNQVINLCGLRDKPITSTSNFTYVSSSIESLKCIVDSQRGFTIIPELATLNVPPQKEDMLKEFSDIQPVREVSLVTNKVVIKERFITKLVEEIQANIPHHMLKKSGTIVDTGMVI
ncbi:MAG: LysR substrate-binding domain-containing protein [Cytophagales bacterium]|nr:LysR substrate-binding domain-containing protein [Cytophagales bacterium]MDW8384946.1 LysR substrate-binding domain-containing protein [Flammeovirgaceae bacterium]